MDRLVDSIEKAIEKGWVLDAARSCGSSLVRGGRTYYPFDTCAVHSKFTSWWIRPMSSSTAWRTRPVISSLADLQSMPIDRVIVAQEDGACAGIEMCKHDSITLVCQVECIVRLASTIFGPDGDIGFD